MSEISPGIVGVPDELVAVPVEDLSAVHIERLIFACERQAQEAQQEYRRLSLAAAEADHRYKMAYSRALVGGDGPMELRKAAALLAADSEFYAKTLAEAQRDAQRELIMAIRLRMDGLRTVSANIRSHS